MDWVRRLTNLCDPRQCRSRRGARRGRAAPPWRRRGHGRHGRRRRVRRRGRPGCGCACGRAARSRPSGRRRGGRRLGAASSPGGVAGCCCGGGVSGRGLRAGGRGRTRSATMPTAGFVPTGLMLGTLVGGGVAHLDLKDLVAVASDALVVHVVVGVVGVAAALVFHEGKATC